MEMRLTSLIVAGLLLLLTSGISFCAAAAASSNVWEKDAHFGSLPAFVRKLQHIAAHSSDPAQRSSATMSLRYYTAVTPVMTHADKTIGCVIDCVPFEQQPSLVFASATELATATAVMESRGNEERKRNQQWLTRRHDSRRIQGKGKVVTNDGFNATLTVDEGLIMPKCPENTVALPRPPLESATTGSRLAPATSRFRFGASVRPKVAPPRRSSTTAPQARSGKKKPSCDYSYVLSDNTQDKKVPSPRNETWVVLEAGVPGVPFPTDVANGHSLNQLWWTTPSGPTLDTLEAGWIACNYFSSSVTHSMFAYSGINNYETRPCASLPDDCYNQHGGLIVTEPNFLGTPRSSVQFTLSYTRSSSGTHHLWAVPFGVNHNFGRWTQIGYYAADRWGASKPSFTEFQVGSEVSDTGGNPTMGGNLYGWGINTESQDVVKFEPYSNCKPARPYSGVSGTTATPFAPTGWTDPNGNMVTFQGSWNSSWV